MIPTSYESWHHCITQRCRLALTPTYIAERLAALRDEGHPSTREFRRLYGDEYRRAIIAWFERAQNEARLRR